jgi:hypothetical protein
MIHGKASGGLLDANRPKKEAPGPGCRLEAVIVFRRISLVGRKVLAIAQVVDVAEHGCTRREIRRLREQWIELVITCRWFVYDVVAALERSYGIGGALAKPGTVSPDLVMVADDS